MVGHQSGNGARVDPAAQEDAQGHVANQPRRYGIFEEFLGSFDDFTRRILLTREINVPVLSRAEPSLLPLQPMRWRQLEEALEDSLWRGDIQVRQVIVQGDAVEFAFP